MIVRIEYHEVEGRREARLYVDGTLREVRDVPGGPTISVHTALPAEAPKVIEVGFFESWPLTKFVGVTVE